MTTTPPMPEYHDEPMATCNSAEWSLIEKLRRWGSLGWNHAAAFSGQAKDLQAKVQEWEESASQTNDALRFEHNLMLTWKDKAAELEVKVQALEAELSKALCPETNAEWLLLAEDHKTILAALHEANENRIGMIALVEGYKAKLEEAERVIANYRKGNYQHRLERTDCRNAGPFYEMGGSHCPIDKPCDRCGWEQAERKLEAKLEEAERAILAMTETAAENSRVKVEDHNQIMELQDQIRREGKMIAAQAGLRADLQRRADQADALAEALEGYRETSADRIEQVAELKAKLEGTERRESLLREKLTDCESSLSRTEAKLAVSTSRADDAERQVAQREEYMSELEAKLEEAERERNDLIYREHFAQEQMRLCNTQLDRISAPREQDNGLSYHLDGRLSRLVANEVGERWGAKMDTYRAQAAALAEALDKADTMIHKMQERLLRGVGAVTPLPCEFCISLAAYREGR